MKTSHSLRGQAVILEPVTAQDNVVQPLVDTVPALVLQQHSPTQSAALLRSVDRQGVTLQDIVGADGLLTSGSLSSAVILAPLTSGRNVIQSAPDCVKLEAKGNVGQTSDIARLWDGTAGLIVGTNVSNSVAVIQGGSASDDILVCKDVVASSTAAFGVGNGGNGRTVRVTSQNVNDIALRVRGAPAQVVAIFSVQTDGGSTSVFDVGPDTIGAFGATPVTKRTGASAAGIAAVTDANAKAALTAIQAALNTLGFITAPA